MDRRFPRLRTLFFGGFASAGGVPLAINSNGLSNESLSRPGHSFSSDELAVAHRAQDRGLSSVVTTLGQFIPAFFQPMLSALPMGGWGGIVALLAFGGFFDSARQWASGSCERLIKSVYRTVTIEHTDNSYRWMLLWLSQQPAWAAAQSMEAITDIDLKEPTSNIIMEPSFSIPKDGFERNGKEPVPIGFLPSTDQKCSFWWNGRYVWVERNAVKPPGDEDYGPTYVLKINMLTRDVNDIRSLIREAGRLYMEKKSASICTYVSENQPWGSSWRHVTCSPVRPLDSIVLEPGIKDLLVDDAREFLRSQDWYSARGIPYRRGYLLHGVPGSGKTSVIHSLAGELGLDVYIISLSRSSLDDTQLSNSINDLPEKCIALMEDIDAAFTHNLNRDNPSQGPSLMSSSQGSTVTLSGLLNSLDGVGAHEGRILFATTNKYSSLDSALCRPGRMDIHIEFKNASKWQAKELFKRFYQPQDASQPADTSKVDESTATGTSEKTLPSEASEKATVELNGTSIITASELLSSKAEKLNLDAESLDKMATEFSEAIPERELSMASLQGYLMMYKTRPQEAARQAGAWVVKTREDMAKMEEEAAKAKAKAEAKAEPKAEAEVKVQAPAPTPARSESELASTDDEGEASGSKSKDTTLKQGSDEDKPCSRCAKTEPKADKVDEVPPPVASS